MSCHDLHPLPEEAVVVVVGERADSESCEDYRPSHPFESVVGEKSEAVMISDFSLHDYRIHDHLYYRDISKN